MEEKNQEQVSSVPPPPKDVRIRTMKSDIQSMALRGGGRPEYEKVKLEAPRRKKKPAPVPGQPLPSEHGVGWIFIWVFGSAAILGALVYFLYPLITQRNDDSQEQVLPPDDNKATTLPELPPYLVVPRFEHKSFFTKEPDELLSVVLGAPTDGAAESGIYRREVLRALEEAGVDSGIVEVSVNKEEGQHLGLVEFAKLSGFDALDLEFLAENFNPDFTFYVFKSGDNFWPGLIAKLKPGKSKLFLQAEIEKLESSDGIVNLYLEDPGAITKAFKDVLVFNEPARIVDFEKEGARFIYGWFHDFFVMSTSDEGFLDVLLKL